MKDSLLFTAIISTLVVLGVAYLISELGTIRYNTWLIFMAAIMLFFSIKVAAVRFFTKYYKNVKSRRDKLYEEVDDLFKITKRDDVSPDTKFSFVQFYEVLSRSLMIKPEIHIVHWLLMSRRIEKHQVELSELSKKAIADIHEINVAQKAIPDLINSIPRRLESMKWIYEPVIIDMTAYSYVRLATDNFVKAMELYAKFEKHQLPFVQDLLEESVHYLNRANRICPDFENNHS